MIAALTLVIKLIRRKSVERKRGREREERDHKEMELLPQTSHRLLEKSTGLGAR